VPPPADLGSCFCESLGAAHFVCADKRNLAFDSNNVANVRCIPLSGQRETVFCKANSSGLPFTNRSGMLDVRQSGAS
jgi:hypothetical protein